MKRETMESGDGLRQETGSAFAARRPCLRSVIGPACALAVAFLMLGAAAAPVCLASPPTKDICEQPDVYDKLKCKHDSVAAQVEYMADNVFGENTLLGGKLTPGQRGQVGSLKSRSARSRNKSAKEDFKKLAKSQARSNKKSCYLVPLTPQDDNNNDGICDYEQGDKNARCAAIELDNNGLLQQCNPEKKNKGKGKDGLECDQLCNPDEPVTVGEETDMEAEAGPMNQAYDSLATDLYDLNVELEYVNSGKSPLSFPRSTSASSSACTDVPVITPGLELATGILRQVSVTARGLAGIAGAGCEQTAVALGFGGNGSVVCMVFETAASILEIAYTTSDEILMSQTGALQTSTLDCLQQMKGGMDAGFANLYQQHTDIRTNDNNNTVNILNKIEEVRAELVGLLNTPQGQRSAFPVK